MVERYDTITVKADVTAEGWIKDKPVITRSGIFTYKNNGKIVREYRPEDEVFKQDSLNTLLGAPITDGHNGILNASSDKLGVIIGSVLSPGARSDSNVVADIIIHNVKQIGNKRELSLGYTCEVDPTPGTTPGGEKYDAIQKDIKYNHLAVVHKGRAGNARIRLDSTSAASFDIEEDTMGLAKIRLDNIEYEAAQEVINKITKLEGDVTAAVKRADTAEAERDTVKSALATAEKNHKTALENERATAKKRVSLEATAKQCEIKFDDDTTDREIKEKVIVKLGHELKFDGKSDDYVDSAFDLAVAKMDKTGGSKQKTTLNNKKREDSNNYDSKTAREKMLARIRGEKEAA